MGHLSCQGVGSRSHLRQGLCAAWEGQLTFCVSVTSLGARARKQTERCSFWKLEEVYPPVRLELFIHLYKIRVLQILVATRTTLFHGMWDLRALIQPSKQSPTRPAGEGPCLSVFISASYIC